MPTLRDQLKADAELFVTTDEDVNPLCETVTYYPGGRPANPTPKVLACQPDLALPINLDAWIDRYVELIIRDTADDGIVQVGKTDELVLRDHWCRVVESEHDELGFHLLRVKIGEAE